jgi:hypothetical protein
MINSKTGLIARRSELLYLDPRTFNGAPTATGGSVAGLQYILPFNKQDILRSIEVIDAARLDTYINRPVVTFAQLCHWFITLKTYDSKVLHKQIPLTTFVPNPPRTAVLRRQQMHRYFAQNNLIDWHQSYVECSEDGQQRLLLFRPIYAA